MGTAPVGGAGHSRGALSRDRAGVCGISILTDKSAASGLCGGIRNLSHIYTYE